MEKNKRKETKNKQKKSHRNRTLDLSMSSPWRNPSATQVTILNQKFKYVYDQNLKVIMQTCLCGVDPLRPTLKLVKGANIIFYFLSKT